MDYRAFLKLLLNESEDAPTAARRHIIRFRSGIAFRKCMKLMKRLRPNEAACPIQPLRMIHAFACPLRSHAKLASFPFIRNIEVDTKMSVHSLSSSLDAIHRSTAKKPVIPWGVQRIKAPQAWAYSEGKHVDVGVIDTGIDYSHPDLRDCIGKGLNLIHHHLPPIDDNGHGTHIAGIIAASSASGGIMGVAPKAIIHPVKAFDRTGSAFVSDIIYGMDWCVQNRIPIINMSFGMKTYSRSLEEAVREAYRAGCVIVASSGNDGRRSGVDYPAQFAQSISVGATNEQKKIAPFSNRGKRIDIYAPGSKIYSTSLYGKYSELSGTSMATSHVSGVIALMLAKKPNMTPRQIKMTLRKQATALLISSKSGRTIKEVNARKAVIAVMR